MMYGNLELLFVLAFGVVIGAWVSWRCAEINRVLLMGHCVQCGAVVPEGTSFTKNIGDGSYVCEGCSRANTIR